MLIYFFFLIVNVPKVSVVDRFSQNHIPLDTTGILKTTKSHTNTCAFVVRNLHTNTFGYRNLHSYKKIVIDL